MICPVHGERDQDGYNADGRCNAIVGYASGWPLLCGEEVRPA